MVQKIQLEHNYDYILSGNVTEDLNQFKTIFDNCIDIKFREFDIHGARKGALVFLSGMVNMQTIDFEIMKPLIESDERLFQESAAELNDSDIQNIIENRLLFSSQLSWFEDFPDIIEHVLSGNVAFLLDGLQQVLVINAKDWEKRTVEEPATEAVIRGPREGFQETISTNISLIRRRLKTPQLKMEDMKVGRLSNTQIVITYLEGIVDTKLVDEVKNRIGKIKIDAILESGYVEELIEDNSFSLFPQVLITERPDRVVGNLLEGKVGIIIDNTPFVIIVPGTFFQLLQSPEDYYQRYFVASAIRMLRFFAVLFSLLLPSLYIALTTYHQEMIPTMLLISIAASRETVPFPAFIEALVMEIAFESLREAGVRLPRPVGQAVSIVGGLVIGQAAVEAGIVSSPLVIVVSMTGIASFIFPSFQLGLAFRLLRFPMMIAAATFGLYGILMMLLLLLIHVLRLKSFGVPYLTPMAPLRISGLKDVIVRASWLKQSTHTGELKSQRHQNPFNRLRQRQNK
ncbi:spore germination protein [Paenibacillus radicis (ex Gao et al. 2016)]|uniref:Spore germination protein n=1 Tax=Paenibacillus radicis (ex Gao et al. 2016) TaxID=1737354 RepID=A0A917H878_9BACL|nr:spore germination protein [Paenibacillus radicis (ex Gao et al. 2016)]GGG70638.1 spore germination protein [Paenibacillus radicis (ex Gao et al. 2016)]